jgi:hypothetical protein
MPSTNRLRRTLTSTPGFLGGLLGVALLAGAMTGCGSVAKSRGTGGADGADAAAGGTTGGAGGSGTGGTAGSSGSGGAGGGGNKCIVGASQVGNCVLQ